MAISAMTDERIAVGLTTLDSEFGYLLETKGISEKIRGAFGHLGIRRTAIFARLAATDAKFREMLNKRLGLNEEEPMEDTVQVAQLVDVWEAARDRIAKQTALESQTAAEGLPQIMPKGQNISMRRAYESAFVEVDDDEYLANDYLSWHAEQLKTTNSEQSR